MKSFTHKTRSLVGALVLAGMVTIFGAQAVEAQTMAHSAVTRAIVSTQSSGQLVLAFSWPKWRIGHWLQKQLDWLGKKLDGVTITVYQKRF